MIKMVRRRRAAKTRTITRYVKGKKTYRRKSNKENLTKTIIGGMLYGGIREKVSTMVAPMTSKLPMGTYADEVGMALVSYFVAKKVSNPTIKSIARAGLVIESAKIGQMLTQRTMTTNTLSVKPSVF